jgi:hypothetical protein
MSIHYMQKIKIALKLHKLTYELHEPVPTLLKFAQTLHKLAPVFIKFSFLGRKEYTTHTPHVNHLCTTR